MFGFFRTALCVPRLRVADVRFNEERINALAGQAAGEGAGIILFPELSLTGVSCGDLFFQPELLEEAENALAELAGDLKNLNALLVFGCPVRRNGHLYDAAVAVCRGTICGIVPKSYPSAARELCGKRQFASGQGIRKEYIGFAGQENVPFGTDLLFASGRELLCALEVGDDLFSVLPPSANALPAGADLILNPASDEETVGGAEKRKAQFRTWTERGCCSAFRAASGVHESTSGSVCSGHCLGAENGVLLLDSARFGREDRIEYADTDLRKIRSLRMKETENLFAPEEFRTVRLPEIPETKQVNRSFSRTPFVPDDPEARRSACEEILSIQTAGLAKRIEHVHAAKAVIGISGGLDSTLALLVCVRTMELLKRPASDVITVTMPGFGTTDRTYSNAVGLCRLLGTELREIRIAQSCLQHFRDIGHDPDTHNVVYENTQARERTQILLDIANGENGIAVGTGDLSESAMGWCTFNGDHISMYGVNASVPKTLIRHVIAQEGLRRTPDVRKILQDIIDTPVSPELLPAASDGKICQKTEEIIGPYEVHDFYLYHFLRYGAEVEKLLFLAHLAFGSKISEEKLQEHLRTFLKRFFTQQFKRNCSPDGPKVGSIALSPHGDWQMPSDAAMELWTGKL